MLKGPAGIACFLFLASAAFTPAKSPPPAEEAPLPPQAQSINGVLVPVPGKVFQVLDTFHDSNWNAVMRPDVTVMRPSGDPAKMALSLGLVMGEGFVAIAAEDTTEMKNLGETALKLARALGVEKSMLRREKSIIDLVGKEDWPAVRQEWSQVGADLKEAMVEIKSEPLSQLVSLGGWLRGTEALSALASQHYSARSAQLLEQPMLLDYFGKSLAQMKGRLTADPIVMEMERGIVRLKPLVGREYGTSISMGDVRKVRTISASLVKSILSEAT